MVCPDPARSSIPPPLALLRRGGCRLGLARRATRRPRRRNPVRRARPTRHTNQTEAVRCPWSEADTRKFLDAARRYSKRPALWWLIASCGARSGEVRELRLPDLDLKAGTLTISRSED